MLKNGGRSESVHIVKNGGRSESVHIEEWRQEREC